MNAITSRRATSLVILGAFLALAVLSVLGNPLLGGLFVVVAGLVLGHHAVRLCPRCSNLACAFNPHFSRAEAESSEGVDSYNNAYSDLPITRTTVIPLLVFGPLAFVGAWQYSPAAAVGVGIVALSAHTVFRRITCSHCGNDCAGNCNVGYREWKRRSRETAA
jgi:hypothetical protein